MYVQATYLRRTWIQNIYKELSKLKSPKKKIQLEKGGGGGFNEEKILKAN